MATKKANSTTYKCTICWRIFPSKSELMQHEMKHADAFEKPHTCPYCGIGFNVESYLQRHISTHGGGIYTHCGECGRGFVTAGELDAHMQEHNKFKCDLCTDVFKNNFGLTAHRLTHAKKHVCSLCGDKFYNAESLMIHARAHTGEKPYECGLCHMSFSLANNLRDHRGSFKREKICCHCGREFTATTLQTHYISILESVNTTGNITSNPEVDMQNCPFCQKSHNTDQALREHMRSAHNEKRIYNCPECNSRFFTTESLELHLKTHTYSCHLCDRWFSRQMNLIEHIKAHGTEVAPVDSQSSQGVVSKETKSVEDGTTQYICPNCNGCFFSKSAFKRHKKIHGNIKGPVSEVKGCMCSVCGESFNYADRLTHMETHRVKAIGVNANELSTHGVQCNSAEAPLSHEVMQNAGTCCTQCGVVFHTSGTEMKPAGRNPVICPTCTDAFNEMFNFDM